MTSGGSTKSALFINGYVEFFVPVRSTKGWLNLGGPFRLTHCHVTSSPC